MKKNKTVYLLLALLCVWCPVFLGFRYSQQIRNILPTILVQVWDKAKPAASTSLRNSNPEMLANQTALETAIGQGHEFSTGGTNSGEHLPIKFNAPVSTPTNAANKGWLYSKDVSAVVELHWLDESGNELQITSGGDLFSSAGLTITGTSTFNGSITLGAGDDLIGSSTSDITFNTNKFTVAGATGNTVVAGTLDVTGNIDPTTYETTNGGFLDEDDLTSDAADKTASQQSIKAYVDDQMQSSIVSLTGTDLDATGSLADIAGVTKTITTTDEGGSVLLIFSTTIKTAAGTYKFVFDVDGTDKGTWLVATSSNALPINLSFLSTGLSVASHTFKVQWQEVSGTMSIEGSTDSVETQFIVIEMP